MKDEKQAKKQWERPMIRILAVNKTNGGGPSAPPEDSFTNPNAPAS